MTKKTLLVLGLTMTLLLVMAFIIFHSHGSMMVRIKNNSGKNVTVGSLKICERTYSFDKLKAGDTKIIPFAVTGDSEYVVELELESGKRMKKAMGYITTSMHQTDELNITQDDIILIQANKNDHKTERLFP